MSNTTIQPNKLGANSVAVYVDGATGGITGSTTIVGITQANIARTAQGIYTADVGFTKKEGSAQVQSMGAGGVGVITAWTGSVITLHMKDFAGADADVDFSLTAQRNSVGL